MQCDQEEKTTGYHITSRSRITLPIPGYHLKIHCHHLTIYLLTHFWSVSVFVTQQSHTCQFPILDTCSKI